MIRPKFPKDSDFQVELRHRVNQYFQRTGLLQRDCPKMYFKSAFILAGFFICYSLLVFVVSTLWLALPLTVGASNCGYRLQYPA